MCMYSHCTAKYQAGVAAGAGCDVMPVASNLATLTATVMIGMFVLDVSVDVQKPPHVHVTTADHAR